MNDMAHIKISTYQPSWKDKFQTEKNKIQDVFGKTAINIEHIGSTSIKDLSSKPIIDIAVLIENREDADKYIKPLNRLGYWYDKEKSSGERHFFRKGKPTAFHLSIAYTDKGNFLERQIIFRDYLRKHPKARDEYAKIKNNLAGKNSYIEGKSEFIQNILKLAQEKQNQR